MEQFEEVYATHFRDVYRYVLSLCRDPGLAEEVTQETFFKALERIDGFRGECSVYVWLCQIAKNVLFSWSRRQGAVLPSEEAEDVPSAEDVERDLVARQDSLEAQRALHGLAEPYREVLMLRIYGDLPFSRIAELFGKTESWARVTYHRGRLKLKEALS